MSNSLKNNKERCLISKIAEKVKYKYPLKVSKKDTRLCEYFSDNFTLPKIINQIYKIESIGRIDELVNLLIEKYRDYGYFYIPQFCTILKNKNYTISLEQYLLERCMHQIKFSIYLYWIIMSYCQDFGKLKEFLSTIEMTLVNGKMSDEDKSLNDKELYQKNINKQFRYNYFHICKKFYQSLKNICEKLKEFPKEAKDHKNERKYKLNSYLNNINKNISKIYDSDGINETSKIVQGLFRGYILPFNDTENISDEECNIIVNFNTKYCQCLSTRTRVLCKLVFEVVKVKDLMQYDEYILENYIENTETSRLSIHSLNIDNRKLNNQINENSMNNVSDFLYKESNEKEYELDDEKNSFHSDSRTSVKSANSENTLSKIKNKRFSFGSFGNLWSYFSLGNDENIENTISNENFNDPFGDKWISICEKIKNESIYKKFPSHNIKSFLVKAEDDLRQECLTLQLIKIMDNIFKKAKINIQLKTYEIVITSKTSGIIEYINDSISIDDLKKKTNTDLNTFYRTFFENNFNEAQKNFAESLAGYSLVTYILNLKDRHNGNILIDIKGRIIHIDYGFILGISPGNMNYEKAPFKMTKEYLNLLDGTDSKIYNYFIELLIKGFLELKKNYDYILKIIEIMSKSKLSFFFINFFIDSDMPCFQGRDHNLVIKEFIERFHCEKSNEEIVELIDSLVKDSINSWRTYQYDMYQQLTNGIKP